MTFSWALEQLKAGKRVRRPAWIASLDGFDDLAEIGVSDGSICGYDQYNNRFWVAKEFSWQEDLLADDWVLAEPQGAEIAE